MRFSLFAVSIFILLTNHVAAGGNDLIGIKAAIIAEVPPGFLKLRISNDSIFKNDLLNEEIIDMVKVRERDIKVPTWYTTHQGGGFGWFIRTIGFYWQAVDRKRHKFVGTNRNGLSLPGEKDELTEHDVNFNLIPHLSQYLNMAYGGRIAQSKRRQFKRAKRHDITKPPYIPPSENTADRYDLHCELTPPKKMRDSMNVLFYPCMHGFNLDRHPNFCDMSPTIGLYGVFVLDCNHSCHPEIHPYEWLWWLNLTERDRANVSGSKKEWMIGFLKESSNRFILWSRPPRVGTISVPFIFRTSETNAHVKLNHLVTGHFRPEALKRLKGLPENISPFTSADTLLNIQLSNDNVFSLNIQCSKQLKTNGLRWWLSDIETDEKNEWIWGYFNLAVSVKDGYTGKLEIGSTD